MSSRRKTHIMRAGHKVTLCGRWPSVKCAAVELQQVLDWGDAEYCNSCTAASLRGEDLEAIMKARSKQGLSGPQEA